MRRSDGKNCPATPPEQEHIQKTREIRGNFQKISPNFRIYVYRYGADNASTAFLMMRETMLITAFQTFNVKFIRKACTNGPDGLKMPYMAYFRYVRRVRICGNNHPSLFPAAFSHSNPPFPSLPHILSAPLHLRHCDIIVRPQNNHHRHSLTRYRSCIFIHKLSLHNE